MIERQQLYQLTVASVPPGGVVGVPLPLDSDAPFFLRRVKSRNIPQLAGFRWQDPKKVYQSNALRTDRYCATGTDLADSPTRGLPVDPGYVYPPNGEIIVDIGNPSSEVELVNAQLIFAGSKLYQDGAIEVTKFPAKFSTLPFTYPLTDGNGQPIGPVTIGLATSATRPAVVRDLQLRIAQDADFSLRYMVADPWYLAQDGGVVIPGNASVPSSYNYDELYCIVKDENKKPYMNQPIHINEVFGQGNPSAVGVVNSLSTGPIYPGLWTPELIIPREHSIYLDLYRYDMVNAETPDAVPVDLWFRFSGVKVFKQ